MVTMTASTRAHDGATPDLLQTIVAATKRSVEVRARRRPLGEIERLAKEASPRGEAFWAALSLRPKLNVIAECKSRSPSRGVLRRDYDPPLVASGYARAGAAAISILTEPTFFDGSLDHLRAVDAAVDLPLLCKDFIVSEYQLLEARAAGADAVLVIVAALDDRALKQLIATASRLDLTTLVEVHDADEQTRALDAGARMIGVNNRNLRTLEVDLEVAYALISRMPGDIVSVAESGLRTLGDLIRLREAGYDAFLIGEALMTRPNPGEALRSLLRRGQKTTQRRSKREGRTGKGRRRVVLLNAAF